MTQTWSSFEFRPARSDDAEAISRLILSFRDQFMVEPENAGAERFLDSVSAEAERGYILSERYDFLLAESEGKLAGFIAMRDRTHLFHLFVSPRFQRRGVARELWKRVLAKRGCDGAGPDFTVNSSLAAVPVYERFGFEPVSAPVHQDGIAFVPMRLNESRLQAPDA